MHIAIGADQGGFEIVCATGLGVSMAANKVRGIRAALCTDCYLARVAREHNDKSSA